MPEKTQTPVAGKRFWKVNNLGAGTAEIWIYEQIGWDWWTWEGIETKELCREIAALNVQNIDVRIMSPGGSVFDGIAIYNALKRHPATVTTYNDSYAWSIASVIFCAGDRRVTSPSANLMIHLPTTDCIGGDAEEMRKTADLLDMVRDSLVSVYLTVTTMTEEEIVAAMEAETYYAAEESLAVGFATEIGEQIQVAACGKHFNHKALGYHKPPYPVPIITPVAAKPVQAEAASVADVPAADEPTEPVTNEHETASLAEPTAQAEAEIQPQGAKYEEVTVMPSSTAAPAAGARNFQKEAVEIITMCGQNHCPDKAGEFIAAGLTPDEAGKKILDMISGGQIKAFVPAAEAPPIVDMGKDAKKYSYAKAISAAVEMREGRNPQGFEVDIHQELIRKMPVNYVARGGIVIPQRVQNTVLTTTGTNTGKETVFQEYGEFIDILRNMMVTTRLGARILTGLKGPVNFPKQTGAGTLYWTGENSGADVTQSNITFGTVTITPKTCQAQGALSRQLILESTPDVEAMVRNDLAEIHALGWDQSALHGTGSNNQPTGIYALSGVNAVAMGGVPTFGKLVDMVTATALYNALLGSTGWATNPAMAGKLMQTLDFPTSAAGRPIWSGKHTEGVLAGYDAIASNQVKANLGSGQDEIGILFGNWADLLIGMWGALELLVDPYTLAGQGLLKITSFQMIDIAARRGESFSKATGAKLT